MFTSVFYGIPRQKKSLSSEHISYYLHRVNKSNEQKEQKDQNFLVKSVKSLSGKEPPQHKEGPVQSFSSQNQSMLLLKTH